MFMQYEFGTHPASAHVAVLARPFHPDLQPQFRHKYMHVYIRSYGVDTLYRFSAK